MANFEAKEFSFSDINGGQRYQNGDILDAETINKPIEASFLAQELAKMANEKADEAINKVNDSAHGEVSLSAWPIGSIYLSVSPTSPAQLFGGTWERIKGRFLLGSGEIDANNSDYWGTTVVKQVWCSAGEKSGGAYRQLTEKELPRHTHFIGNGGIGTGTNDVGPLVAGSYSANSNTSGNTVKMNTLNANATGQGAAFSIMPPFLAVYMWKRVS